MKDRLRPCDVLSLVLLVGTLAVTIALYGALPAEVPTHFDVRGEAAGLLPRALGAFVLPFCALGVFLLLRVAIFALPGAWTAGLRESPTSVIALCVVALACALQGAILYGATHQSAPTGLFAGVLRGGLWLALGVLFPRLRRNPWVGICTPWALASDEAWTRTQRFAGQSLCAGGLLALAFTLLEAPALTTASLVVAAFAPLVYSFLLPREKRA